MLTPTPITWTVRTGPSHTGYGAPYDGVATVQRCGDVARVSAACGKPPIQDQVELARLLRGMGFAAIVFETAKDGEMRRCRRELTGERKTVGSADAAE